MLDEYDIEQHISHENDTASMPRDIDIHVRHPPNCKPFREAFCSCSFIVTLVRTDLQLDHKKRMRQKNPMGLRYRTYDRFKSIEDR